MKSTRIGVFGATNPQDVVAFGKEMSTAIVCAYTPEGFVIGADGRRMDTHTGAIETESAQKIFSLNKYRSRLVFAWCGMTHTITSLGDFDLPDITKELLFDVEWNDFSECLTEFVAKLSGVLRIFQRIDDAPDEFARGLFLGYFNGEPFVAEVSVFRDNERFLKSHISQIGKPNDGTINIFSGCEKIGKLDGSDSLEDASAVIEKYIQSCIDDPECADIGGRIHIGALTPERFTWIRMP